MYRNRDRLGGVLTSLATKFGPEVFRDPRRVRNLMLDEYGVNGFTERPDIDQFVTVLEAGYDEISSSGEAPGAVSGRIAARTGLPPEDATWTVSTLRALVGPVASPGGPAAGGAARLPVVGPAPAGVGVGATRLGDVPHGEGRLPDAPMVPVEQRGWPAGARRASAVLALTTIVVVALAAVLVVQSRRDASEYRSELNEIKAARAADAGDSDDADDDPDAGANTDEVGSSIDDLNAELEGYRRQVDDLTAQLAASTGEASSASAAVTDLQARLSQAEQAAASAQAQLDAANTEVARLSRPFSVDRGQVVVPNVQFTFRGSSTRCEGFVEPTCQGWNTFSGTMPAADGVTFFEIPNVVRIPLATNDGLTLAGQAGTSGVGVTCKGAPVETVVSVSLNPLTFSADPALGKVAATSYSMSITFFNPALTCTESIEVYAGTLTFRGLS